MSLDQPVTRREVIGWAFASPVLLLCFASSYLTYGWIGRLDGLLARHEIPSSFTTELLLTLDDPGVAGLYFLLGVIPVVLLLSGRRTRLIVIAPLLSGVLCMLLSYNIARSMMLATTDFAQEMQARSVTRDFTANPADSDR